MEDQENPGLTASDEDLVLLARAGDRSAFAELWQRHARSGLTVARQFTSSIDADDLVSEAYARIYQRVLAGGGPDGAFRPYLYTTIRNLAARWGQRDRSVNVDDIGQVEDVVAEEDPATLALDRTLTARAFRSLPERWQSVLWYTEVEGMDPHEVAPLLGLTANGVAALSYRAREGLRKAWLQAHVGNAAASGECQWAISRIGDYTRNGLSQRDRERVDAHLATCSKCAIISEEVDEVGSRLALVMIPLLLGGAAGGTMLASLSTPGSAMAQAVPQLPPAFDAAASVAVAAPAVAAGLTATTVSAPLIGTLALALAVSGGLAATTAAPAPTPPSSSVAEPAPSTSAADSPASPGPSDTAGPLVGQAAPGPVAATEDPIDPADPTNLGGLVGGVVGGVVGDVGSTVGSVIGTISGSDTPPEGHTAPGGVVGVDLSLRGTGTPGAHLSLQAAGQVYATTTVAADGTFVLNVTAVPGGLASLDLVQTVDRSYLANLLGLGGAVGQLLGGVDALINNLIAPLHLSSLPGGVSIRLLS